MTESNTVECPYCKSIRYNVSQVITGDGQHVFCRNCDNEFVVIIKGIDKIAVKKILPEEGVISLL